MGAAGPRIIPVDIEKEMKESFIAYAMAVIINRALPDVRDGLKPVHRRILYSMSELGLTPDKPYRKSARIVGDVLGKYHPHGDTAIYDTMVRMAQDFSLRYPLVQGHGNFGSVDGDGAAAMRYTEARASRLAMLMMQDLDKDTVDFYPNFDNSAMQPKVLPSRFPNLLVNGSGGIAVGMATNIPPHNLGEVIDAVVAMIDDGDITVDELMQIIPGPDFPTGGVIMGTYGVREAYRTGRGRIVVRARTEIEQMTPTRARIIVTEIPYQVNKARLVEKIAELVHDKRIEGISDLRDESDRNGMRIVIELKNNVNAQVVLNLLFKHTQMQDTFGAIMLALVDSEPKVLNLREMIHHYLEHQKEVIVRRTRYELERAEARAHILEGLLIALDHIDEVIALIRASKTQAEAKSGLIQRFSLSEKQAQAILEMRLQRLVGLERTRLEEEYAALKEKIDYYRAVLADEGKVLAIIREEILQIRGAFSDERRTEITALPDEIDLADLIEEKEVAITLTHFGYVKRLPTDTYRAQHRGGRGITALSKREEDFVERVFTTSTHQDILFFTNFGKMFIMKGYEIPEASRQARGTAIVNLLALDGGEKITAVFPVPETQSETQMLVMSTKGGIIKKTPLSEFRNMRRGGLRAIVLREGDELIGVQMTDGSDEILVGTRSGMCIRFLETDIRPMGRVSMGVRAVRLQSRDWVVGMDKITPGADVLVISGNGFGKRTPTDEYRTQARGGKGIRTLAVTDKTGPMVALCMVSDDNDVMLISDDGTIIRMDAACIRTQGRATQGVTLMRLAEDSHVVAAALSAKQDEQDEPQCDPEEPAGA
ncbi:MAG: DNA gyrase subunit A [Christensenellales bacterium]